MAQGLHLLEKFVTHADRYDLVNLQPILIGQDVVEPFLLSSILVQPSFLDSIIGFQLFRIPTKKKQ